VKLIESDFMYNSFKERMKSTGSLIRDKTIYEIRKIEELPIEGLPRDIRYVVKIGRGFYSKQGIVPVQCDGDTCSLSGDAYYEKNLWKKLDLRPTGKKLRL
jgi:hypothetical protein